MPSVSLSAGDRQELLTGSDGETVFLRSDGDIRVAKHSRFAKNGRQIPADEPAEIEFAEYEEPLYVHADEAATVMYELQGFSLSLFGREIIRVDGDESTGELPQDTQRVSADAVKEVNADQTANVGTNSSQTTTVTADAGELWELKKLELHADRLVSDTGGATIHNHEFVLDTEKEGVEIGKGVGDSDNPIDYLSGSWSLDADGDAGLTRDDITGTQIDDTNGLNVTYTNGHDTESQDGNRRIRLQFSVTKV